MQARPAAFPASAVPRASVVKFLCATSYLIASGQTHRGGTCVRPEFCAGQVALGATGVAAITVLCFPAHLDLTIPGFLYLLLVVFLSVARGLHRPR